MEGKFHQREWIKKLTKEEIDVLSKRSSEGDIAARDTLIRCCLYLVKNICAQYKDRGVEWDDLFQEGCYGLLLGIDHYRSDTGATLDTYAAYWIRKYVQKAVMTQNLYSPIVLPEHIYYKVQRYLYASHQWQLQHDSKPTVSELSELLGISEEEVESISHLVFESVSADAPYPNDLSDSRETPYLGKHYPSAEDLFFESYIQLDDEPFNAHLSAREEEVLRRHLGFTATGTRETYKEISSQMGLSVSTIQQIYRSGIGKLRSSTQQNNPNRSTTTK